MRRDPARCDARGRRRGTAPSLTRTAAGCCRSCTPRPGSAPAAAPPARRFFCAQSARPQGWGAAGRVLRRAAPRTRPTFCAAPAAAARGARRERRSGGRAARGEEGGAGRDPARRGGSGGGARRQVLVPAGADGGRAPPLPAPAAGAGRRLQPGRGERDRPARGAGQPLRLLAGHAPAAAAAGETAVSAAAPRPGPSFRRRPRRRGASGLLPGGGGRRGGRHLPRSARGRRGAGRRGSLGGRDGTGANERRPRTGGFRARAAGSRPRRAAPPSGGGPRPCPPSRRSRALEGSPSRLVRRSCCGAVVPGARDGTGSTGTVSVLAGRG